MLEFIANLEDETENREMNRLVRNVVELVYTPNISEICPTLAPLDLQGIVKDELAREINLEDFIAKSHVPNLTYIQACIKEALRLYPSIPFLIPYRVAESCQVTNYTISKDSMILMNLWAIEEIPIIGRSTRVQIEKVFESEFGFQRE
ncbi:hypothetical protein FEM48_Zijuj11G0043300 [Ziziphus jujuba var. spinosa]|uniref:Uncharacterized protein n=1 Tax=Ziziphus jujuba var. spinosa TaxID=714518 RepID=A0A978UGS9_ZIZJJ|nr:hypothetical protein FEM48_Zijuj11G0043300 [Ziziphus jujuba var. spinosa]